MNKETLTQYVVRSQRGDRDAQERLLLYAYGLVDYQCRKLLPNAQAADKMTLIVLKTVLAKLDSLENPEEFFTWLGRLSAVRCMRVRATLLENGQEADGGAPQSFSFPSMELNKAETAKVAEMLTDMLPQDMRLNLYLYALGGLPPKGIAGLTGVPEETVQQQIQEAQTAVLKQMKRYADQGVTFTQANSLPALLRTRMLLNTPPEKARLAVYTILPQEQKRPAARPSNARPQGKAYPPYPQAPQKKSRKGLIRTLAVIAALLGVVLVISLGVLFTKLQRMQNTALAPDTGKVLFQAEEKAPWGDFL